MGSQVKDGESTSIEKIVIARIGTQDKVTCLPAEERPRCKLPCSLTVKWVELMGNATRQGRSPDIH